MKTQQQYEDEAIGRSVSDDNCIGFATQRKRFRQGWDAAMDYLAHLPWDEAIKEIAEHIEKTAAEQPVVK